MIKVGLTGGIASGKSTVCEIFSRLGAKILDADEVAREAVQPGRPAWAKLRQAFGPEFFDPDGSLRRGRLRRIVFADTERRRQLNAIVHPEVMNAIQRWIEEMAGTAPSSVLVVDVPLLLEVGATGLFDRVLVVFVDEQVQLDRLMRRDGLSLAKARQTLRVQMPLREKVPLADYVIDNSGSVEETKIQVREVWPELLALAQARARQGNQKPQRPEAVEDS